MSVMTSFTLRTLKKNRVRTIVSIAGIALSCALLTAVFTSVASIQGGLYQRTLATEGSWQVHSSYVTDEALATFEESDKVVDLAVSREIGSAKLSKQDSRTLGEFIAVRTLPDTVKGTFEPGGNPLTKMPEIKEGRMPESPDEIVLPDYCQGQTLGSGDGDAGAVSSGPLALGSSLELEIGTRIVNDDGEEWVLDSATVPYLSTEEGSYKADEELVDTSRKAYTVVGFYERQAPFRGNSFTAAMSSAVALTVGDAASGGLAGAYFTVQGFGSVGEIRSFVDDAMGEGGSMPIYHGNLFSYQGFADDRPIWGTLWMIAFVLAVVIVAASISLIYNSFAISVADRTRQFGLLSSIGASKKQLRRSVLAEAMLLGVIGIPIGILVGFGGTAAVFSLTQEAFAAMLGGKEGLAVAIDGGALAVVVALSVIVLLASAWVPALRAGRVSAVDAVRQTQDVRISKRAARKARASAAKAAKRGESVRAGTTGIAGRLFGAPGFIAHRNLTRSSARGRTVVASLAVSVALIVISGGVALYMTPLYERADAKDASGNGADIVVSSGVTLEADYPAFAADLESFLQQAESIEGVTPVSVMRQGQADVRIPAAMISTEGRSAREAIDRDRSMEWVDPNFAENGDYLGDVMIFYLDQGSWAQLVGELGLDEALYTDADNPLAIGLNRFQGSLPSGHYGDIEPFATTGSIDLYAIERQATGLEGNWTSLGLKESDDGSLVVSYLNQDAGGATPETVDVSVEEVSTKKTIEIGALSRDVPVAVRAGSASANLPVILLPDIVADNGKASGQAEPADADEAEGEPGVFSYWWANLSFAAENHAEATTALEELAEGFDTADMRIYDIAASSQQNRMIAQAMQLFIFCFSVIMLLIAVANVFNTLTNSIILRTREFAMLKSVGMGDRAFTRMLVYECASYALRGLAIGLVVAGATTYLLYRAVSLSFDGLAFELPWAYLGAAVAVVLVVLAISVVFALKKGHGANVVEALRADAV